MSNDFDRCLVKVLVHEGGYVNNPKDPGGETNKGITKRVYDDYRKRNNLPPQSVKLISPDEVSAIYKDSYWNLSKCEQLPTGVSYVVFDGDVNSGVSQSVKWLQRALGVKADGVIGPATLAAVADFGNYDELIDRICDRRMAFLRALKTWSTFGKGWTARVNDVRAVGKAWASNSEAPVIAPIPMAQAKAPVSDAKAMFSTAPGYTAASAGGVSALLAQAQDQLAPFTSIDFVAKAAAILTIAGVVIGVAGIGYRFWVARRNKSLADALDLTVPQDAPASA